MLPDNHTKLPPILLRNDGAEIGLNSGLRRTRRQTLSSCNIYGRKTVLPITVTAFSMTRAMDMSLTTRAVGSSARQLR